MTAFEDRDATSGDDGVGSDVATSPASSSSSPSTYQKSPEGEQSSSRHLTFQGDDGEGSTEGGGGKRLSTTSRMMIPLRAGRSIGTENNNKIPVAAATLQGNVRETNTGSVAHRGKVLYYVYWGSTTFYLLDREIT